RWGSNAWLVAPARSESGHALLWGGPQEGLDNPNIDWEMYIRSAPMKAGGMMIAGVPGVLIGQTNRFAWTTTSGEIDNSTLYVETLGAGVPRAAVRQRDVRLPLRADVPADGPARRDIPLRRRGLLEAASVRAERPRAQRRA